jgi:signal transduction histidine kinase
LLVVIIMAFMPSIVLSVLSVFLPASLEELPPGLSSSAIVSLPLFPAAYLYAVHRRRLGNLQLRIHDLLSSFIFLTIVGTILLPFIVLIAANFSSVAATITFGTAGFLIASVIVLFGHSPFRTFFERRILGIPLPSKGLLETYSTRITTSNSLAALVQVLEEEILPTLLIRQFAFLHIDQGSVNVLSTMGLDTEQIPGDRGVPDLIARSGYYRSPDLHAADQPHSWIRLVLSLKLGDQLIGFWLLGRRDPDDLYSQSEIPILSSLANLTAIALSNILQTERLQSMYETNISRYEEERLRLAHDLHDSILNELAALLMRADAPNLSPEFQKAADELTDRLREIVDHLRPPMLAFGLKLALEGFADDLLDRGLDAIEVRIDIQADGDWRYPEVVESNLYRIVQEASENSLRHAQAKTIMLFGRLRENDIEVKVKDNGIGFHSGTSLRLNDLLANKHFGLVGMFERAKLIDASLNVTSSPNEGTEIQILWKADQNQADLFKKMK